MISTKAALFGAAAACVAPGHIHGARLKHLLGDGPVGDSDKNNASRAAAGSITAVHAAHLMLRVLARIPVSPWKNTCLYRSVAGCLAQRWLGQRATLRIGARRDGGTGEVQAHAWIEGLPEDDHHCDTYHVLTRRNRAGS